MTQLRPSSCISLIPAGILYEEAMETIHAVLRNGTILKGTEASQRRQQGAGLMWRAAECCGDGWTAWHIFRAWMEVDTRSLCRR